MISEKRLYRVVSLTGIDFQKQGRGVFFFCSVTYTGFLKAIFLRIASQQAETKPAPVRPCVRFWGQGRETTPGKPQTGPVEAV